MKPSAFKFYRLFWGMFLGVLVADQLSKYIIQMLERGAAVQTFFSAGGFFSVVYVQNTGAAWGMMAGSGTILGVLAVLALAAIYFLRRALGLRKPLMQVAFGLLAAGIAGNMIDRLCLGYVIDFIDVNFAGNHFPAFNFADMGITIGVALYILFSSFEGVGEKKAVKV